MVNIILEVSWLVVSDKSLAGEYLLFPSWKISKNMDKQYWILFKSNECPALRYRFQSTDLPCVNNDFKINLFYPDIHVDSYTWKWMD